MSVNGSARRHGWKVGGWRTDGQTMLGLIGISGIAGMLFHPALHPASICSILHSIWMVRSLVGVSE
eukprot:scaffold7146_cov115-Isochrysis_galbana.AAC.3